MTLEASLRQEMKESNGDLRRAARNLGFNYKAAMHRLSNPETTLGFGRPELRKYIVAYRRICSDWPDKFREELAEARRKYNLGTHEMCQGRDGDVIIQYLIPRLVPTKPRRTFGC